MSPDILADRDQLAGGREQAGGMEPARLVEGALGGPQEIRQGENDGA